MKKYYPNCEEFNIDVKNNEETVNFDLLHLLITDD